MKIKLFLTVMMAALVSACGLTVDISSEDKAEQVNVEHKQDFIHAAYVVGDRLFSRAQLDQTRFSQFDFFYTMAGPKWSGKDFDKAAKAVFTQLVEGHEYPEGNSGIALVPEFINKAHKHKAKVLLSIPGTDKFNHIAQDRETRAFFARVMAAFVEKHNYDGIEIDWEHTFEMELHLALMDDLREELNLLEAKSAAPRKYYLTTAIHSYRPYSKLEAQRLSQSVDWVNIMTYDMGGGIWGNSASHNTPLNMIREHLKEYWSEFSPDKLCLGLANYGFYYEGLSPNQKIDGSLKTKGRYISYKAFLPRLSDGWQEVYDDEAQVPYYFSPDKTDFVTMDNPKSLNHKVEFAFEQKLRGAFWWELSLDYFPAKSGKKYAKHPLIDHVNKEINVQRKAN